jgi:hypothetical protein
VCAFTRAWLPLACVACAPAHPALAQDFSVAGEVAAASCAAGALDTALPSRSSAFTADALAIGRYALPELSTRALAAGAGWRSLRGSLGISQTGAADVGWSAAALAAGVAHARWGAGLRALARRDQDPLARLLAADRGIGGECGAAAWLDLEGRVTLWASAPQLWVRGAPPPLSRGLTTGIVIDGHDARAWFEHEAGPEAAAAPASHRAGVALGSGPFRVWVEGFDAPLRGAVGIAAEVPFGRVSAAMESHPVLGETVRLALMLGAAPARRPETGEVRR